LSLLTYLLLFRRMSGWVGLHFVRLSFVQRFSWFHLLIFFTYVLLFWRMPGWADLKKISFVSRLFNFPPLASRLGVGERRSHVGYGLAERPNREAYRLRGRSGKQCRTYWLQRVLEGVTNSSTSQKMFSVSWLVDPENGFLPQKRVPEMVTYSNTSQKKLFLYLG